MLPRRAILQSPLALAAHAAMPKLTLSMHQYTSAGAGYQKSLEGWAKAGIKYVEPVSNLLDDFLKKDSIAAARRVLDDNGLSVISAAAGVMGLWDPNPKFAANCELFKKRCEQFTALGTPIIYSPCGTSAKYTPDDYTRGLDNIRQVADIAAHYKIKVGAEFVRTSTYMAALPTALRLHREAKHPNFGIIFDCYHFWTGPNKLDDMDQIQPGEILHAHLNDTPDMLREQLDLQTREIPGDGIAPLDRILRKLLQRGYSGHISVELFWPKFQQADPQKLAAEIKTKSESLFRKVKV